MDKKEEFIETLINGINSNSFTLEDIQAKYGYNKVLEVFDYFAKDASMMFDVNTFTIIRSYLVKKDLEENGLDGYVSETNNFIVYHNYLEKLDLIPVSILRNMNFERELMLCKKSFYDKVIESVDVSNDKELIKELCGINRFSFRLLEFMFRHYPKYDERIVSYGFRKSFSENIIPVLSDELCDNLDESYVDMFVFIPLINYSDAYSRRINALLKVNPKFARSLNLRIMSHNYYELFSKTEPELSQVLVKDFLLTEEHRFKASKFIFLREDYKELYELCKDCVYENVYNDELLFNMNTIYFRSFEVFNEYKDEVKSSILKGNEIVVKILDKNYVDFYVEIILDGISLGHDVSKFKYYVNYIVGQRLIKELDAVPTGFFSSLDEYRDRYCKEIKMPEMNF